MTSPLFDQSTKFISSECQEWFLEISLLSGERWAAQKWDWQARCLEGQHRSGYLESLEMLSWRYQMGWSRKASNTQSREIHENSSDIHFIWVKNGFHIGIHCLHQAIIIGLHDASWRVKLESNDYPLLQHSKVKLLDICIHTMLRTWLVHIVIYSDHSWKIK